MVASIDSYCCYVVFAFSIGVWDAKLAKTSKAARVASINRVMLLLLFRSCVFHWCLQHESGQNRPGCESSQLKQSHVVSDKCSFCVLYWCLGHKSGQNRQGCESGQLQQSRVVSVIQFLCSLLVFWKRKWPEQPRLRERLASFNRVMLFLLWSFCVLN